MKKRRGFFPNISVVQHLYLRFSRTNQLCIRHNFNTRKIGYFIYDDQGNQFIPDKFQIINDNEVYVEFNPPTSGEILLIAFKDSLCWF